MSSVRLRSAQLRATASKPSVRSGRHHEQQRPPPRPTVWTNVYDALPHVLTHPCTSLASFFSAFGTLLSTHQVPSLLVTALIICSLLSPSLLLYFAPTSPLSTSPLARRGRGELVWELEGLRRQGLIATEEPVCWDRIKRYYEVTGRELGGRRLRVEQLLISVDLKHPEVLLATVPAAGGTTSGASGTITKQVLHKSWQVQAEIEKRLVNSAIPGNECLREVDEGGRAKCAIISPTQWWSNEQSLLQDEDVHETLSRPPRHLYPPATDLAKPRPLPLTISEAFVGVGYGQSGTVKTAQQLILTFFLEDVPSRSNLPTVNLLRNPLANAQISNSTVLEDQEREQARANWRNAVREVMAGANPLKQETGTTDEGHVLGLATESKNNLRRHVLLKFLPHLVVDDHPRRLENIIYAFGYLLVIIYVARYIRRLRAHSKMGLIVTGVAELCSSGIMSVSICWLMGWNLGLVPWNLMAFLVLTSGLDNMILVLRAISQTDLNLPVPERMALGLRQVGVEMTVLLLVEELIAAWLLWFVEITVMRQWIRFGAVVLAVDYFLELTFFSTVLSIDIQRLELADLLAHNTALSNDSGPTSASVSNSTAVSKSASRQKSVKGFVKGSWQVLRDRPAKTSTVAFLWVINVLLWAFYGSEHYLPATCSQTALSSERPFLAPSLDPSLSRALRLGQTDPSAASHLSVPLGSGEAFWSLLNPNNASSVQIYLEPVISIQLFEMPAHLGSDAAHHSLNRSPAPESIQLNPGSIGLSGDGEFGTWTKVMIVILPILAVMGLLRLLLMYLLKDAELLQARWGSEDRFSGRDKENGALPNELDRVELSLVESFEPNLRQHKGDVELIASGGEVVVSWAGLEEEVQVLRKLAPNSRPLPDHDPSTRNDSTLASRLHIPLAAEPVSLVSLSVDVEGKFCAAVTNRGRMLVWALERGGTLVDFGADRPRAIAVASARAGATKEVQKGDLPAPPTPTSAIKSKNLAGPFFYSLHADGQVVRWSCGLCRAETLIEAETGEKTEHEHQGTVVRRQLIAPTTAIEGSAAPMLAFTYADGRCALVRLDGEQPGRIICELAANEHGSASVLAIASFSIVSSLIGLAIDQGIVAVSHAPSVVTFYTLSASPSPLVTLPSLELPIRQIRLSSPPADTSCSSCLERIPDGFLASISTRATVKTFRIFTPPIPASIETCACNSNVEAGGFSRSRAPSLAVVGGSPVMSRVLSNGSTSARRFSARKRPATPTRPNAFSASASPITTAADPFLLPTGGRQSSSSSSNESSAPGSPTGERRLSFSSHLSPPPPPPPAKRSTSETSLTESTPSPSSSKPSPDAPFEEDVFLPMRADEVASVAIDDRGSWEVSKDRLVGLRRKTSEKGREWQLWTLSLGRAGGKLEEGYCEAATPFANFLGNLGYASRPAPTSSLAPPYASPRRDSALRRRQYAPTISLNSRPSPSMNILGDRSDYLPFSRAGPMTASLSSTAVSIAIGNQVITLSTEPSTPIDTTPKTPIKSRATRF
ncbi:uncharacterized protein JCM15063_001502 [Sporobolomyces koalae]|uniref:uncharacterized protein n=1 Tax=Sporobolomyces koalae TaxID=500713 RepID=UPI00316B78D1